jgi:hypothetical protein
MPRRRYAGITLVAVAMSFPGACGSSGAVTGADGSGGQAGHGGATMSVVSASSTGSGVGGSFAVGCTPPCTAGMHCSVTNTCIPEGTCNGPEDCSDGLTCDTASKTCIPGGNCGSQEAKADLLAPNILMVLDRSCSMNSPVNGVSKWQIALTAIGTMLNHYKGKIRFGLTLFPDLIQPECGQSFIPFPPLPNQEALIGGFLVDSLNFNHAWYPKFPCLTNIDTAIQQAAAEPALGDTTRQNFVMLITDGSQSFKCSLGGGDAGTTTAITALQAKGVKTFVVGFGGSDIDPQALNAFADAGGTALQNSPKHYYDAADAVALDQAIAAIANQAMSCTYALEKPVDDPNQLYVFLNNDPKSIPRDATHADGWDYDAATNSVTFYGAACDLLKSGKVSDVDLVYGCSEPTPG